MTRSQCGENEIFVPSLCEKKRYFKFPIYDFNIETFEVTESEYDQNFKIQNGGSKTAIL